VQEEAKPYTTQHHEPKSVLDKIMAYATDKMWALYEALGSQFQMPLGLSHNGELTFKTRFWAFVSFLAWLLYFLLFMNILREASKMKGVEMETEKKTWNETLGYYTGEPEEIKSEMIEEYYIDSKDVDDPEKFQDYQQIQLWWDLNLRSKQNLTCEQVEKDLTLELWAITYPTVDGKETKKTEY